MEFPNPPDSFRGLKTFGRLNTYHLCQKLYCMFLVRFLFYFESLVFPQCSQFYLPSSVFFPCLSSLLMWYTCVLLLCVFHARFSLCFCISAILRYFSFASCVRWVCSLCLDARLLVAWLPGSTSHFCVQPPASSQIKDFAFRTMFFHLAPYSAPGPTLTSLHGLKRLEFLPAQHPGRRISPGFG